MKWYEGFFLGLSTGMVCLAYCGPLLMPYLLGEGTRFGRNTVSVSLFLGGRLIAYLIVGFLSGILGNVILQPSATREHLVAIAYILLSALLIAYGFHRFGEVCLGTKNRKLIRQTRIYWPSMVPFTGGVLSGFNICPPFLLAITKALDSGNIAAGVWLFFMFFLGTTVYFLPMPLIGLFNKRHVLRIIGKFAAILAGLYYFYVGIKLFFT
jgi:sulfite exporter TauE/SafE